MINAAEIHPDQHDPLNGVDDNCDGVDGVDSDGDNEASIESGGLDCNDSEATIHPGATDNVGDSRDSNCDGHDGTDLDGDGDRKSVV